MPHARGHDLTERPHERAATTAWLGLGSNVGAREANVLAAARVLRGLSEDAIHLSALFETTPVGCEPMRDFVNAVAQVRTLHSPGDLLKRVQAIERMMGRSGGHNEPRELDIDIIAVGDRVVDTSDLTLPHPRFAQRSFVLVPLQEIAPHFRCPATGRHIDELVDSLPSREGIRKISARAIRPREAA